MDAAAAGHQAVFVDTNLDTHLVLVVSPADTVSRLKQKLLSGHKNCFPEVGEIKIHSLKVKRKGHYYHLPDSMLVCSAFLGVNTNWFFFAEVSIRERNDRPLSNGKNVRLDGPSNDVAVVYGSSSQFVCDQAWDQRVRNSDQLFEDDFESLRRKVFDNNVGNGQSSLNEIIKKSGDDKQQKFQLLNEKDEVHDGTKEGNSKSCSTDVTCTVSAEESLDAGREGKKKKKRKKRVLSELAPKNNDGDVANVPEKDMPPGGGDSTFGSMEKAEREVSPRNDDADGPDLPAKEILSDDLGLTSGNQEKGVDKLGSQYGSGEGDRDLSEKEILPDDLGPTFESLENGEDELAAQHGRGEGDANHGTSNQKLESEHAVDDWFRTTDADPQKRAQKKKGKKKKSSKAAADNVVKDQLPLIVGALRATTVWENGATGTSDEIIGKVAEDIANVEKDHQADVGEKSQRLKGGVGQSSEHPREVLQESPSTERHKVENGCAAREAAEVGKEVLPDSRKNDSVAREMQENGLRGKDKSKKKRKGSDSVYQVIPSVPSATTGENGEEEVIYDHIEPASMEQRTEILTELKDASVTEASNFAREISPAGAASLSAGKKSKKRKKNADDATVGSHQSIVTDYHAVIKSPEFRNIIRNSFDENNDSRHDVARTLLHMPENNAAETLGFEHLYPTSEAITVKEKDDADVPDAGKKRKSKKAKKSIAENQTVPGLETISTLASQLPLDKSDKGISGSEAGKTCPLHGALAGLDGATENVELPMGIHDEPDENLEKKAESNKKKSKKKNRRAASVLEGAPLAGHEELEGNLDTNGRRTETTGKQSSTASISDSRVDGEADDTRSNREEESVPLSQNKHPSENMGNKSKKKRTKSQNSVMIDTAADDIGRKTDKLSHNEAEPEPQITVPVEKPQENLGNEKQTRRKLKLSAGDSSHSLLEEANNFKAMASLNDMLEKVDTDKIAMKTKSTKASSVDETIFSSGNDVETESEPSHPRGTDAIASGHNPPIANGISDPGDQKNAPKEKGGSKSKTHELNSNRVQDEDHQEVASDGVPTDLGKKAKKLGVNEAIERSSLRTSSHGQSFGRPNNSAVSERTMLDQNDESVLGSNLENPKVSPGVNGHARLRADPNVVALNEKKPPKGKSNKRTNSVDINKEAGAPVAKRHNADREVQAGKMKIDQYRMSYRKPSDKRITEALSGLQGKKTLPRKSASLFQDASSVSSEDEGLAASSNSTTKSPDDNLYSSDDSEVSSEATTKISKLAPSNGGDIAALLRRSARYKKAQLNASQSQQQDMDSQDVEMVPESEPIM
ncbi:hypothetical protein Droror1_Dr00018684 [Drosera rotundifolia]